MVTSSRISIWTHDSSHKINLQTPDFPFSIVGEAVYGMSKLRVDLQEGFAGDAVNLLINGRESLRKEGVTTKNLVGLANSSEIEVPDGPITIEIQVPTKNLSKTISLETSATKYLGFSIENGRIGHVISQRPFGYA